MLIPGYWWAHGVPCASKWDSRISTNVTRDGTLKSQGEVRHNTLQRLSRRWDGWSLEWAGRSDGLVNGRCGASNQSILGLSVPNTGLSGAGEIHYCFWEMHRLRQNTSLASLPTASRAMGWPVGVVHVVYEESCYIIPSNGPSLREESGEYTTVLEILYTISITFTSASSNFEETDKGNINTTSIRSIWPWLVIKSIIDLLHHPQRCVSLSGPKRLNLLPNRNTNIPAMHQGILNSRNTMNPMA